MLVTRRVNCAGVGNPTVSGVWPTELRSTAVSRIIDDNQSAYIRITGTLLDAAYKPQGKVATWTSIARCMGPGTRCSSRLGGMSPACRSLAQLAYQGRAFVALINLNGKNNYRVKIHARKRE